MTFHVEPETVARYRANLADRTTSASVEAHLFACAGCRQLLIADAGLVERTWTGIRDRIEPGEPGLLEQFLLALRVPDHYARLIAVTPNLRVSFFAAVVLALVFAAVANLTDTPATAHQMLVLAAPIIPVLGVALAYGRIVDPAFEMALPTPVSALALLLLRSSAVLAFSVGVCLLVWPFVPAFGSIVVAAWLLPSLMLTLATIAVSSRIDTVYAASGVAMVWVVTMLVLIGAEVRTTGATAMAIYSILAVLAGLIVTGNKNAYEQEGILR